MHACNNCIARNMNAHAQLCEKMLPRTSRQIGSPHLQYFSNFYVGPGALKCVADQIRLWLEFSNVSWGPAAVLCSSPWRFAGGHDTSIPHMEVIYKLLGVQVNVGDRWGAVKHYFIRWTWFTDFSKTKSTLLGTNLQTWSVQVKMLLTNLLTWRVLQTWRVQVNEE